MDNIEKYDKVFIETFSIEKKVLKDLKYNKIEKWHSIGHMTLISDLENSKFFKLPKHSFSCLTVLDPIRAEVTVL